LQIEERIARLEAELQYWRGKTTEKGTIPEHICNDISARLGEIAALNVRLKSLPNTQAQARPALPDAECSKQPTNEPK
jgi:hypothetical protein